MNRQFESYFGVASADVVGKSDDQIFPAEQAAQFRIADQRVLQAGVPINFEEWAADGDGARVSLVARFPLRNPEGHIQALGGIVTDITERHRTEIAVRTHAQFIEDVLNSLSAHVAVLDQHGVIIEVNESWRQFAARNGAAECSGFIGSNYLEVCRRCAEREGDPYARAAHEGITAVLRGGKSSFSLEYPCPTPERLRWFILRAARLNGVQGGAVVKHHDITEQRHLQDAIRLVAQGVAAHSGTEFFRNLLEELCRATRMEFSAIDELVPGSTDRLRVVAACTPQGSESGEVYTLAGTAGEEVLGRKLCCFPDNAHGKFPSDPFLRAKGIVGYIGMPLFDSRDRALGLVRLMSRHPLNNSAQAAALLQIVAARVAGEIERERSASEVRNLSGRLLRMQDRERRTIGRELHDSTAQELAALEIALATLERERNRLSSAGRDVLRNALELATRCTREIRSLTYILRPPLLDEVGLVAALRVHVRGYTQRSGVKCRLNVPRSTRRPSEEIELALFRIAQEALANVHRHSGSRTASIKLTYRRKSITLEVADRGHGMPVETLEAFHAGRFREGLGLMGMIERIRQLGGEIAIQSTSRGTCLQANVPWRDRSP